MNIIKNPDFAKLISALLNICNFHQLAANEEHLTYLPCYKIDYFGWTFSNEFYQAWFFFPCLIAMLAEMNNRTLRAAIPYRIKVLNSSTGDGRGMHFGFCTCDLDSIPRRASGRASQFPHTWQLVVPLEQGESPSALVLMDMVLNR